MVNTAGTTRNSFGVSARCLLSSWLLLMLGLIGVANAQTSSTDGTTPMTLTAGAPAGSYGLSGFDNINLFNGNLNFRLPLLQVGGRGEAQYTMMLPIENHWRVLDNSNDYQEIYLPTDFTWYGEKPGYGPGLLLGRAVSQYNVGNCMPGYSQSYTSLTRLNFILPDGTEYEFRDQATGGQQETSPCYANGYNRGTVFVTADGTAATFVSDTPIYDRIGPLTTYPAGYLSLRSGLRYRIDGGKVSWMRDRNGNKLSFSYGQYGVTSITDSLNRQVTVSYADFQTVFYDQIIFNGFGGAQRTIRINYSALHNVLRTNRPGDLSSVQTKAALFPELTGSSSSPHDPYKLSSVVLPDGVQQFQFSYNVYGELARVVLPTGGMLEYDFGGAPGTEHPDGVYPGAASPDIYRRVFEKRLYRDANTQENKTVFNGGTVDQLDPTGTTLLSREKHYFYGDPMGGGVGIAPFDYPAWNDGKEYQTEVIDTANCTPSTCSTVLRRTVNVWQQGCTVSSWSSMIANNPRVIETDSTLVDTNQITKETFAYDCFNNKTDTYEYDFAVGAAGALVRHAHTNYVTATSYTDAVNGPHLRNLVSQTSIYNAGGVERGRATYEYDNYNTDANHAGLTDRPSISGLDPSFNTLYTTRGNVTATTHYLLNDSGSVTGSITAYAQDDIAGNVVKVIDGRGFATTLEFSDRFGTPDGEAELNPGPTNLGGQTSYAFPTKVTNFLGHIAYTQFDYYLGRPVDAKDANGIVSSGYFNDVLDRPSQVIRASNPGTGIKSQTSFSYDDTNRIVTTTSDLNAFNDPNPLKSQVLFDSLGRTIETRQYEDAANYIAVQTQYDSLGRPFKVSNPFRPWQSEIAIWTTSGFDALGRVVSVTTPDSAVVTTSYSGNSVTVMDQLGRQRKSVTDGLGRLTQVYEDPTALNYLTSYSHDVLDNLTMVAQGSQTRTFVYDSLKRLTSATNPESGTVSYSYDNNSNLLSKTDARGVVSSYVYDALNRNTTIDYSDTTGLNPDITLVYDGAVNGKGRLWESYAGGNLTLGANVEHTKIQSYDPLGRPLIQVQDFKSNNVWGPGYQMQRSYNLAGGVTSQTYPSSEHTVSYSYDSAGRTSAFTGNLGDGVPRTYSTGIVYSPLGGMTKEQFGTDPALYNKLFYNSRGQLSEIREGTSYTGPTDTGWERGAIINFYGACWGMCGGSNSTTPMTDNNGNLKRQETYIPNGGPTFAQTFDYDSLNRLQRVTEGSSWQQEYIYDPYGNRTIHQTSTWGSGINKKDFTVNTANNRLGVPTGQTGALTYDNAGNLTNDTYTGAGSRTYDAENRMTTAWGGNNQSQIYTYNANGQRTRRKVDGVETWQIYGFGGELLAEYAANAAVTTPQKEYGYRNGQLLITATVNAAGWGAPPSYTGPNPLSTSDQIKLENLTELRSAVNQLRQHAGLSSFSFTVDPSPDHSTTVKADHIRQLRTALEQARTALGLSTGGYAHPTLTENTSWIYAIDFQELRNQIASAWNSGSGVDIRWLMTDQLGTPRMVFDKTGALANMSRHDYLPFGEELFAGTGGRTSDQGYPTSPNAIDAARQKFTQKERDNETGLDYFGARYYASLQGRFTSVDPLMASASTTDPQSLNRYAYVRNRPLGSIDPNGMDDCEIGKTCSFTTDDWATSGNHPEEGQIQESVDVNIGPSQPLTTSSFDPEAVPLNLIDLAKPVLLDQYVPTPGTMPNSGGHDTPDPNNFAQLNVSIAALVVTADFSVTRDDFGNWYVGAGPGLGLGFPVGGSFVTGTTISDLGIPTYDETSVRDILGGPSTTVTAGAGLVGTRSWNNPVVLGNTIPIIPSSEGGGTRGIGLGTPQIGISQQDVLRIPYLRF